MNHLSIRPHARHARRLLKLALALASLASLGLLAAPGLAQAETIVSIQFDDGMADQYQALPILASHGMHGTFFINSAQVGTSGFYMNWNQVHDVAAGGNEIGGHTLHHPDLLTLSAADATLEICDDRTALVNQGFTVTNFAYPYGHTNAQLEGIVRDCGYESGRGVTGIASPGGCTMCPFAETIPPPDPYLTRTPENAESTTTLADLQGYVTQAEQHGGGWVQIVIHHVCLGCGEQYSTPPATLDALLAWLEPRAATGTVVRTTAEALHGSPSSDVTPPTVALTAPANGASLSGTVALSATASDNVGVSRVEFYQGATLIGTTAVSPYSVNWDTNTVANGSHVLTARAYDAAGNTTTSASRTVTVANVDAHATIVSLGFDDGDADQFQVRSMLTSHGMDATFYINSGRINAANYMTLAQLQALQSDGNEIAGHTVTHADLPTLDHDEAMRQVCNDRQALLGMGFPVRSFAYPYGDVNAATESIVSACGYNSARIIGGLVTPTSCSGCAYAESNPPADVLAIRTNDSIKSNTTLAQMQGYVLQAEQHGGGLVPLVVHHVSTSCTDAYCVSPTLLDQFLTWLQARQASGTIVAKIGDVIGGAVKPGVDGPPPPPPATGPNLIQNPSLETDANTDLVPDCWQLGGFGNNAAIWSRVSDAHTGSFGEQVAVSSFTDGDRRLITRQDLGSCSPSVTPGRTYLVSAWYKTTGNSRIVVYTRSSTGTWVFFAQQAAPLATTSTWTKATFTTPAVPAGTTALSIGVSLRSTGTLTLDDFSLGDTDQTAPTVALTAPTDGQTVTGNVALTATASDPSGIARVDYLVNGNVIGSSTTAPSYSYTWDSRTVSGSASIAARAVDTAGNAATSPSALVTVSNNPADTTPPSSTATCDGGACTGSHTAGTLVALSASDAGSGVAEIRYTTDGTTPTAADGLVYAQPFTLSSTTTVRFRAYDIAGNEEAVNAVTVSIDEDTPTVDATCDGAACDGAWKNGPVTVALSAADAGSGIDRIVYTLDGSAPTATHGEVYAAPFSVTSTSTVRYRSIDMVGTLSAIGSASVRIDTVAPQTTASCDSGVCGTGWSTGPVSVTLAATDDASGVARTVYTTDGTNPTESSTLATGPITVSETSQIRFRSYDEAGNAEVVSSVSITVDATAPSSSASCNGSPCSAETAYTAPLTVALAATDAGSGVAQIRYTTDGSTPTATTGTVYAGSFALAADTTVTYRAFDVAGNAEAPTAIALHVSALPTDTTPPVTTVTCSGGPCASWHTGPVTVTLAATDDLSGVASTRYTTDGTDPSPTTGTAYTAPITVASTTGLRFRSYDVAGNAEAVQSVNVPIDATVPTVTATCGGACPTTAWSRVAVNVTLAAADTGSGVGQIRYTTDGSTPTDTTGTVYAGPFAVTTSITLRYRAFDVAGNASALGSLVLRVDVTPPTVAATCNGGGCAAAWYASPLSLALTASDTGSGVASIRYTTNGNDPTPTSTAYNNPISVTSSRSYRFRAYDVAGNAGAVTRLDIQIDSTAPVVTARCNGGTCPTGWVNTAQSVALTATDSGSGVARIVYTTNGTTPSKTNGQTYTAPINVTTETTVAYIGIDAVGNASAVRSVALRVDLTAPTVTITAPANGSTVSGTVHITGTAQDHVVLFSWYLDGLLRGLGTAASFNFSWNTNTAALGPHTIFVRAVDQAGNPVQSATISVTR
jgi:peptidoglycan/xylan/chitin deacetylase (PgdA/CDA1 family)